MFPMPSFIIPARAGSTSYMEEIHGYSQHRKGNCGGYLNGRWLVTFHDLLAHFAEWANWWPVASGLAWLNMQLAGLTAACRRLQQLNSRQLCATSGQQV
ncbi:hypothetical protein AWZ03_014268 [Drosophila navojoa]|uniref:Uncharacterized protein n=1 Tax=Drosophila navojoa TaxID=7232 RepID=A0A484ASE9_DRONA|nr:hypothetical protein AWZ03_014268 [Drosophila navojoa]